MKCSIDFSLFFFFVIQRGTITRYMRIQLGDSISLWSKKKGIGYNFYGHQTNKFASHIKFHALKFKTFRKCAGFFKRIFVTI